MNLNPARPMKKILILLAIVGTGIAAVLAVDPGRFAFTDVDAGGHKLDMFIAAMDVRLRCLKREGAGGGWYS